jgi:abortive infection bacteriophage resistance protein
MFTSKHAHSKLMIKVTEELQRSKENFILHYRSKYTNPVNPPAWMALEVLSFGQLSIMYKNLKANEAKKAVAEYFGISYTLLISWMEHLGYIRNLCAHHSRLWNRTLTIKPTLPRITKYQFIDTSSVRPDKAFVSISIMAYMLERITPRSYFTGKLISLLHRFKEIDVRPAGFYKNWHLDPFWKSMKIGITYQVRILIFNIRDFVNCYEYLLSRTC